MGAIVQKVKTCSACRETKNVADFYSGKGECKPCNNMRSKAYAARKRQELGEEAYLALNAERARKRRQAGPGKQQMLLEGRIQTESHKRLREAHPKEWRRLLAAVRREMTDNG